MRFSPEHPSRPRLLGVAVGSLLAFAACGGGSTRAARSPSPSPTQTSTGSPTSTAAAAAAASIPWIAGAGGKAGRFGFDAKNFVDPTTSTNTFHPLRPGTQWVRGGTTEVGHRKVPHQVISTMTDVTRVIDGVTAVAMLDQSTDSGETSQVGFDWFGLDKAGNVWILGGYTEDYEGGRYTNTEDAWLGAATGGDPGVLLPGHVDMKTPRWFEGSVVKGEAGSAGEPAEVGTKRCVKFGCFDNVLVVREGEAAAIDNELKYYAPGVGLVDNVPHGASLHQDTFQLLNVVTLSPQGLGEASQIVLDLEAHGRTTSPKVYGSAPPARRP
jgi:hypothetical protein